MCTCKWRMCTCKWRICTCKRRLCTCERRVCTCESPFSCFSFFLFAEEMFDNAFVYVTELLKLSVIPQFLKSSISKKLSKFVPVCLFHDACSGLWWSQCNVCLDSRFNLNSYLPTQDWHAIASLSSLSISLCVPLSLPHLPTLLITFITLSLRLFFLTFSLALSLNIFTSIDIPLFVSLLACLSHFFFHSLF